MSCSLYTVHTTFAKSSFMFVCSKGQVRTCIRLNRIIDHHHRSHHNYTTILCTLSSVHHLIFSIPKNPMHLHFCIASIIICFDAVHNAVWCGKFVYKVWILWTTNYVHRCIISALKLNRQLDMYSEHESNFILDMI